MSFQPTVSGSRSACQQRTSIHPPTTVPHLPPCPHPEPKGQLWFSSVSQSTRLFATPWTAACQASLSITSSWSLLKLMSIGSVMPSNHLILCRPLLLPPSIFPSIRIFSNESVLCIRWPKYWSFSFSICPSSEYSGLISFRTDWFDLFAVQGTLKTPLQNHSSKASILRCSAFFIVQLAYPCMTTGKTLALTRRTFVCNEMSLLFNMLPRLVVAFFDEFQIQKLNEFSILPVYRRNHLPSVFQIFPGLMEVSEVHKEIHFNSYLIFMSSHQILLSPSFFRPCHQKYYSAVSSPFPLYFCGIFDPQMFLHPGKFKPE